MDLVNNYIIAKYKDNCFYSFNMFRIKLFQCENKIYDKIDLSKCYRMIVNYQISKYGSALNDSYSNMKDTGEYKALKARIRKYQRRNNL